MLFKKRDEIEVVSSIIYLYDGDFDDEDYVKLMDQINNSTQYELYIDIYQTHLNEKYIKPLYNILKNKSTIQEIYITAKNDADDTVLMLQSQQNSYIEENIRFQIRKQEDIHNKNYFNFLKYCLYNYFTELEINQLFEQDYYINSLEAQRRKVINQIIDIQKVLQLVNKNF